MPVGVEVRELVIAKGDGVEIVASVRPRPWLTVSAPLNLD